MRAAIRWDEYEENMQQIEDLLHDKNAVIDFRSVLRCSRLNSCFFEETCKSPATRTEKECGEEMSSRRLAVVLLAKHDQL